MPSSYVSGRVISDQTEHSRAIIVGYVPSGHYFWSLGHYFWSLFPSTDLDPLILRPRAAQGSCAQAATS